MLEKAGEVGGTWRENTYPGCECDVPSHLYELAMAPNPNWSRNFSSGREIQDYLCRVSREHNLRPHISFNTEVTKAVYSEAEGLWIVSTAGGKEVKGRYLVSAVGVLSTPVLPQIEGINDFKGRILHSAKWDSSFSAQGLRVGVIGTGASAIQMVPCLAKEAKHLTLFQRSPAWVFPKTDRNYRGIEKRLLSIPLLKKIYRSYLCVLREYWLFSLKRRLLRFLTEKMSKISMSVSIANPELRRALTPSEPVACKRALLSNDYYPALARQNVSLVTDPVRSATAQGIITKDGTVHQLDALVCATGFRAGDDFARFPTFGRGGLELGGVWKDGAEAYRGTTVHGFPNMFMISGPNTYLGHNSVVLLMEAQIDYIAKAMGHMSSQNFKSFEVKSETQESYNQMLRDRFRGSLWESCMSWYRAASGKNTVVWPGHVFEFQKMMTNFDVASYQWEPKESHKRQAA